ncbi:cobalamin B12-binding domain protein [Caldicellulosiruptor saccharolyticus DSM 8903]|uniref:Cobalamin B12-binding domain protein n=2 Tax=Caldicellulosiruptor saccharolyticus TaxID=44001 RepID=A4XH06_CALS8|nr:cobalamin B12-binding domain protein [Caldicellulosiruptor saccharolyticus DSM 8903]
MTRSHVILIQACKFSLITEKYKERYPYPPFGLICLANILKMNGYDVTIIDLYLEPLSKREFVKKLTQSKRPLLIGISSYTDSILDAYKIAETAKEIYYDVPIIMGGPHVSFMFEEVMKDCYAVDFCCLGEGEPVLVELLEYLQYGVPNLKDIYGLVYRNSLGQCIANPKRGFIDSLDIMPFPWFSEKVQSIIREGEGFVFVSSRGCPGECIFCASRALSGPKYRCHSAEWLASLIYYYYKLLSFKMFGPLDDTFTANRIRLKKFLSYLKILEINIPWSCKSRVDVIDGELVEILYKSKCISVHIGVESGDDEVLKSIEKRITVEKVLKAITLLASKGIRAECSFIIGHPSDTLESIERTLILADKLDKCGVAISVMGICTPFPGTKIWNRLKLYELQYGLKIHTYNWRLYDLGTPIFSTNNFTLDDLRRAFFYFNYLRKTGQILPLLTKYNHSNYIKMIDDYLSIIHKIRSTNEDEVNQKNDV